MKNYNSQLADIIARELLHNTRKQFASLHADAIEEINEQERLTAPTNGRKSAD
jgi:hypothetical protein